MNKNSSVQVPGNLQFAECSSQTLCPVILWPVLRRRGRPLYKGALRPERGSQVPEATQQANGGVGNKWPPEAARGVTHQFSGFSLIGMVAKAKRYLAQRGQRRSH